MPTPPVPKKSPRYSFAPLVLERVNPDGSLSTRLDEPEDVERERIERMRDAGDADQERADDAWAQLVERSERPDKRR